MGKENLMYITKDEYISMGLPLPEKADINACIARSSCIITGITEGKAENALKAGGKPAELVKRAAAFQTYLLMRESESVSENSSEQSSEQSSERVSVGDFSYSTDSKSTSGSSVKAGGGTACTDCLETEVTVINLLRSAGCFYAGVEVAE